MSIDTIGNFLTSIRNGLMASRPFVLVPSSHLKLEIAKILKEEGFIKKYEVIDETGTVKKVLKVFLKYVDGESVIHEITRYSTPGCRRYAEAKSIKPVIGGLGLSILTTNRGVISHKAAQAMGVGGEIICTVW
jgi:small subunit ribosomal protein S8